jgi:hypothetical protein
MFSIMILLWQGISRLIRLAKVQAADASEGEAIA